MSDLPGQDCSSQEDTSHISGPEPRRHPVKKKKKKDNPNRVRENTQLSTVEEFWEAGIILSVFFKQVPQRCGVDS